jgi:phosphate transport system permease protein
MYKTSFNSNISSQCRNEAILVWLLRGIAIASGAIVVLIVGFLVWETLPILQSIGLTRFFSDPDWHPTSDEFNLTPMLWGTLLVMSVAVVLATPLGILSAVFCQYYAPAAVAQLYRRLIELTAGIPSVVYGFWGLVVLVPTIGRIYPPGPSWLAGSLILALMILPTVALVADASLAAVPSEYFRACAALGLGRWATVRHVVFPAAKSGLLTGIILATGRAIGETMAVLMVCGNVVQMPKSVFDPVRTLTANIALEMAYAAGNHRAALFVSGLVLMVMILVLAIAAAKINQGHLYD